MTVGEKILKYRKELGISQDELGQKLLVSRQTISLWEKGQTLPTIDNLIRLKDIFGVSVDELLGEESTPQTQKEPIPNEHYTFKYTTDEINQIYRLQEHFYYKNYVITLLIVIGSFLTFGDYRSFEIFFGFMIGIICLGTALNIKNHLTYRKLWKPNLERLSQSIYEYKIFDNYLTINISCNNETTYQSKCYFDDIDKIKKLDNWLLLQYKGRAFIIRISDLKENSALYFQMHKITAKAKGTTPPDKLRVLSIVLFVGSLLSIFGAMSLVGVALEINQKFLENMWLFFLMTPITIGSTVFGFILKSKGYKYKKNVIAGIIMTTLLCIYGSFPFIL